MLATVDGAPECRGNGRPASSSFYTFTLSIFLVHHNTVALKLVYTNL